MSWMEQLVKTYDENERFAGKPDVKGQKSVLAPVGHMTVNAQIDITLNRDGNLIGTPKVVPKDSAVTLIPCTPDSASRTSGLSPHPLYDKLQYVARDYEFYSGGKKKKNTEQSPYEMYCQLLEKWVESKYSHPKVRAVYQYIANHNVIQDLIDYKILFKNEAGDIIKKWSDKKDGPKPELFRVISDDVLKAFVRFRVDMNDGSPVELWNDTEVQKLYEKFCLAQSDGVRQLCYASGKEAVITEKHFKYIRFPGDGAKLISSNDNEGYTYRGRFQEGTECATISLESSHKAMNALRWLISNQGYVNAKKVFLAWGRSGIVPPNPTDDTVGIIARRSGKRQASIPETMKSWADALNEAIAGYRHEFKQADTAQVNVMILDAATPGRLSICYYDEMEASDFIDRIEQWHKAGTWRQHKYDKESEKWFRYYGVPLPKYIVSACYGERLKDSQTNMELERLFHCIVNGRPVPYDMVSTAVSRTVKKASQTSGDEHIKWYRNILEPTCSLIKNQRYFAGEGYSVALDPNNTKRAYLYGRLLAAADKIERATFNKDERSKRLTNAMKYMERFSQRPASTWQMLQMRLLPYEQKMEKYSCYRKLLDEIGSLFKEEDFVSDRPLENEFLLGFYCQNYDIEKRIQEAAARKKQKNADDNSDKN